MDSASRVAMTRRICDVGSSRYGDAPATVAAKLGAAACFGAIIAASMSRLTIRPFGPEPDTDLRSTPLSAATRAAIGETIIRPLSPWLVVPADSRLRGAGETVSADVFSS